MATVKKPAVKKKATVKKAPVKKVAASKAAPAKKVVSKKAPIKKTSAKKTTAKQSASMKSFRVAHNQPAFTTFKITRQTVYWTILICFIIFVQLWILKLQIEVSTYLETQLSSLESGI